MNKVRTLLLAALVAGGSALAFAQGNPNCPMREQCQMREDCPMQGNGQQMGMGMQHGKRMGQQAQQMAGDDVVMEAYGASADGDFKAGTTLENLQAAYNGESNANAMYLAFAKKADAEGYGAVASLFRAAARAEQVHAENHASIIKSLGAEPAAEVKLPEINDTAKNLKAAVAGESFERDTMYPNYIRVARQDRNRDALRSFNYAQIAEGHHAKYYSEAGEELLKYKDSEGVTWYVCPTCGETIRGDEFGKLTRCPVCFTRSTLFMPIS